jgi:site-specific recombinase XerD
VHWKPGDPLREESPEALLRFFLRPNAEYLWETAQAYATEAALEAKTPRTSDRATTVDTTKVGMWECGEHMDLERITEIDPYDLTGAQRNYVANKEFGFTDAELQYAAERTLERYAPSTLRALTAKLRDYLQFCQERHLVPVPAERPTITRYLSYLTIEAQKTHGRALQPSSIDQFRDAIRRAHEIAGYENPWTKWPVLADELRGYRRLFSRPVTQSHAIRLDELAALVGAANASAGLSPRDAAILTIVADPEVGISLRNAAALTWKNITWFDVDDPQPTIARVGTKEYEIPNRAVQPMAEDLLAGDGETPISVRLCGTTALRSLAAELVAAGKPVAGPVFRKDDDTKMTYEGVSGVIKTASVAAGLSKASTYAVHERIQLLEAASRPDPLGLRDSAIMNLMWWASLRRSEVGPLTIGDLGKDDRGRGLILLIRKSKTDVDGQYVHIPLDRDHEGNPRPTDTWNALQRWFAVYETMLGRPLEPNDPLFSNIMHIGSRGPAPLSGKAVDDVIVRYAAAAGIHAELGERISSHGFRAGYATESLANGKSSESVAKNQRRSSTQSLLGYNRPADPFESLLANTMQTADEAWERFEMAKLNAQILKEDAKNQTPPPHKPQT